MSSTRSPSGLIHDDQGTLRCVIAEVTNTFGDRIPTFAPIPTCGRSPGMKHWLPRRSSMSRPSSRSRGLHLRFDIRPDGIGIGIDYSRGNGGLIATLTASGGPDQCADQRRALAPTLRLARVLALIHWQALKLWGRGRLPPPAPNRQRASSPVTALAAPAPAVRLPAFSLFACDPGRPPPADLHCTPRTTTPKPSVSA